MNESDDCERENSKGSFAIAGAQRKARRRENRRAKRRAHNVKPREVYLAEMASKPKPWIPEGISRRTWERRLKAMSQGVVPIILTKVVPDLASPSSVESQGLP